MKINLIKQKFLLTCLCLSLTMATSGCIYLVIGSFGALGGYVVSPDTVEGITANDKESLWDASINVVSIMGLIEEKQSSAGIIIAKINGAKVTITIMPLNQSNVRLTVKARKAFLPKISIAQDVFVKVMSQVNE